MAYDKKLPKKSENLSEWYNAIILQSELADYGLAKGTMIFRPYGYAIWEQVQKFMDNEFKARGVQNAYFPLFIPESLLNREKEHIEGFSPELAVVTIGDGEELKEKLIVRPTSETIMYEAYSRWIHSWRDLPMLINQWNNVVRWEKRTYLFLRTTEFLWQEGHTAHATHAEALETVQWAMDTYIKTYQQLFAMPGITGRKSDSEKFAGADRTVSYETLMPEGKALQSATSHDLGQNFATSFNIEFQNQEGKNEHVWQTSWGLSTRSIGGLIMTHGDDKGLRLPPKLAPIQVIILPVRNTAEISSLCENISRELASVGIRVKVDADEKNTLGWRINDQELKGVPLRLEIGEKELSSGQIKAVRRDTGEHEMVMLSDIKKKISTLLESIQLNLYHEAQGFLNSSIHEAATYEEFKNLMESKKGFIRAFWCGDPVCEKKVKEETKATTRCLYKEGLKESKCIVCGNAATEQWYFAQAY